MLKMVLRRKTLLASLLVLISLTGCSFNRKVVIHPIEKSDIFFIPKNSKVVTPKGDTQKVEKDGWFLSEFYVEEVMKARVESK